MIFALILTTASPALADHMTLPGIADPPAYGGILPMDGGAYTAQGIIVTPCKIGSLTGPCELDTGSGWPFAIGATDAAKAKLATGKAVAVNGGSGSATVYYTQGTVTFPGAGTPKVLTGDIVGPSGHTSFDLPTLAAAVGPVFAVDPRGDAVYTTIAPRHPIRPLASIGGHPYIDVPCGYGDMGSGATSCEVDPGAPVGILISVSDAEGAGIALGTKTDVMGISGQAGTAYTISTTVTLQGIGKVTLHGYASAGYTGTPILGTTFLTTEYPNGYIVDTTDGTISGFVP